VEARPYPTLEWETCRGRTHASENAAKDAGCGAAAHVACLLRGFDLLEYDCERVRWLTWGTRLGDPMCRCFVLLHRACASGFSHFPLGEG